MTLRLRDRLTAQLQDRSACTPAILETAIAQEVTGGDLGLELVKRHAPQVGAVVEQLREATTKVRIGGSRLELDQAKVTA